ncbi:hypothetical protein [Lactococcus lactis]|uniref:hypothetical protein n=1 Tax=Lactococcus lactis TaxID=1358 RepID=UPI0022E32771|nr:hypothetical protein [Lactococcus lactis]
MVANLREFAQNVNEKNLLVSLVLEIWAMETSEINPGARSVVDKKGKMITFALRGVFLCYRE